MNTKKLRNIMINKLLLDRDYERYLYGIEIVNWKKKHGNNIYITKVELPKWIKNQKVL